MQISRFWRALDDLTEAATDLREWKAILDDSEHDIVETLLKPTGTLATSIACPSPGGDGCPRRIVRHADGTIRAVCGDSLKACDDLDLNQEDITIFRLDRVGFARRLAEALGLSNIPRMLDRKLVFRIGTHDVFAGRGLPVFLTIPGPGGSEDAAPFAEVVALPGPKLLLTPTADSITASISAVLDRAGVARFALCDVLIIDKHGRLQLSQPLEVLFAGFRVQIEQEVGKASGRLAWRLPPDARWKEIGIRFIADEVVNVTFRNETRRFEPDSLGLKNANTGKPVAAWTFLKAFALRRGRLPVHHANARGTSKYQKQKQALSKALRGAFGIAEEPIPTEGDEYVTRFALSADDLQKGRQGQVRRNFVGLD